MNVRDYKIFQLKHYFARQKSIHNENISVAAANFKGAVIAGLS